MATAPPLTVERARAQAGPQEVFLACKADIGIYGGGVYGGKSWALTYGPLRYKDVPGFSCVTFRRTRPDLRNPGSLWDESLRWYPDAGGVPREQAMEWDFPSGALIKFDGLQHDSDALSWKSAQIALVQFDQLEEFTEFQFWYMQSRNRTACGVDAFTRAGCNPLADTWLAELLSWWWDQDTGYAIPERSGMARFFIRVSDQIVWSRVTVRCDALWDEWLRAEAEAKRDLTETHGEEAARFTRSLAFIRASLRDNPIGVAQDPGYEGRVRSMSLVEQERLLAGNWKIRAAAGLVFNRDWFEIIERIPEYWRLLARARYWDKAGTAGGGDWTVGCRESLWAVGPTVNGQVLQKVVLVEDEIRGQWGAGEREATIADATRSDPPLTRVGVEQEPGSGGKDSAIFTVSNLQGIDVRTDRPTGNLIERAQPFAAQAQRGNVKLLRGPWNEGWLREHHAFPTTGVPDDRVAASTGCYKRLVAPPPLQRRRGIGTRSTVTG